MSWVDNLFNKLEEVEAKLAAEVAKREANNTEHNATIAAEIAKLDALGIDATYPGKTLAELQLNVLRSQIRLLKLQWEKERK